MAKKIIFPGEELSSEEEYVGGKNTFTEKGIVKSKIMGRADYEPNERTVSVEGKSASLIQEGDIVIGKVTLVKESTAVIELLESENGKKIGGVTVGSLPVRNISKQFVDKIRDKIRVGDIVKARVTAITDLIVDLATNENGLGIIKAYCSNCKKSLDWNGTRLTCMNCHKSETRKWFEETEEERSFSPRGDRGDRGFGHGRSGGRGFGERRSFGGGHGSFGGNRGGSGGFRKRF
jgi:exosome complex component CSL4